MTNSQRLATVRDRLIRWIADHSSQADADGSPETHMSSILSESILIRDGFYCGRRFNLGSHRAVWFFEEDALKIYAAGGELACVLEREEISDPTPQGAAANIIRMPVFDQQPDRDHGDTEIRRAA